MRVQSVVRFSPSVHPIDFTLAGGIAEDPRERSSKCDVLFGWAVNEKAASSNTGGQAISLFWTGTFWSGPALNCTSECRNNCVQYTLQWRETHGTFIWSNEGRVNDVLIQTVMCSCLHLAGPLPLVVSLSRARNVPLWFPGTSRRRSASFRPIFPKYHLSERRAMCQGRKT